MFQMKTKPTKKRRLCYYCDEPLTSKRPQYNKTNLHFGCYPQELKRVITHIKESYPKIKGLPEELELILKAFLKKHKRKIFVHEI